MIWCSSQPPPSRPARVQAKCLCAGRDNRSPPDQRIRCPVARECADVFPVGSPIRHGCAQRPAFWASPPFPSSQRPCRQSCAACAAQRRSLRPRYQPNAVINTYCVPLSRQRCMGGRGFGPRLVGSLRILAPSKWSRKRRAKAIHCKKNPLFCMTIDFKKVFPPPGPPRPFWGVPAVRFLRARRDAVRLHHSPQPSQTFRV